MHHYELIAGLTIIAVSMPLLCWWFYSLGKYHASLKQRELWEELAREETEALKEFQDDL